MGPCPKGLLPGLLEEPSWAQHSSGTAEGQIPGGSSTSLTIIAFSHPTLRVRPSCFWRSIQGDLGAHGIPNGPREEHLGLALS